MVDKLGQEIKVGSIIAYGSLLGRSAALQIGKVTAVKTVNLPASYIHPAGEEYRITVQGVTTTWQSELKLLKKGTLLYPDRIIVLDPSIVPEPVMKLLDTV